MQQDQLFLCPMWVFCTARDQPPWMIQCLPGSPRQADDDASGVCAGHAYLLGFRLHPRPEGIPIAW